LTKISRCPKPVENYLLSVILQKVVTLSLSVTTFFGLLIWSEVRLVSHLLLAQHQKGSSRVLALFRKELCARDRAVEVQVRSAEFDNLHAANIARHWLSYCIQSVQLP
jgi:hypothetical protein